METTNEKLSAVPSDWPGAFGIYKYSKQAVQFNLNTLILLLLLNVAVGGGFGFIFRRAGDFLSFILGGLLTAATIVVYLASLKGTQISFKQALSKAVDFWLNILGLNLLVLISVIGSLLLLVVPFFFVLPRLVLANYFLIDKDMGIMEAYKASWHATQGYSGKVWGVIGANLAMALLFITIIGIPFAVYFLVMYSAAFAVLYKFIVKHGSKTKTA